MLLDWSEGNDSVVWADYYTLVAAVSSGKAKTSAPKRRASQSLTSSTPTASQPSPPARIPAVTTSPSPNRYQTNHSNNDDPIAAAQVIPTSPPTSDSPPQPKRPRLSAALVDKRVQHQQEREAADAYFQRLQDKLDEEKAQRVAELDARQQVLQAEEDAAQQAYAEAVVAGEAWISKCAIAATAKINTDDIAAATAQLARQLTGLVEEYMQASWRTSFESGCTVLSNTAMTPDDINQVSRFRHVRPTCSPAEGIQS